MIEDYFEKLKEKYHDMKKAYKRYIDLKSSFYEITGVRYDEMPREKGRALGLDDLMENIETQYNYYLNCKNKYEKEKTQKLEDIKKVENKVYRLILEYAYIDYNDDKTISKELKKYHNIDYSFSYLRKIKERAKTEFKKIIEQKGTKRNNIEQQS